MEYKKRNISFKLTTIIVLMIVTAIISGLTAGVIVYTSYGKNTGIDYKNVSTDSALKQFLEVYSTVTSDYYEDVNKTEMIETAIDAMLKYLGDRYTSYLNVNQTSALKDSLQGEYQGIGVTIRENVVIDVFDNSPAKKAGINSGDEIIKINNTDVTNMTSEEIVSLIKNNNEVIHLTVKRNGEELNFELSTSILYVPAISHEVINDSTIGYIRIATFSSTVSQQVKEALDDLSQKNISSLILDLRANSGGYLKAAEDVANLFLEKGKVIYSLKSKNSTSIVKDKTSGSINYPVVVLIDENTASAAEILAAALKDSYGAILVGNKSFGKGKVQQIISLVDGSTVKYTTGKWYTPLNENIDKKGLIPDHKVKLLIEKDDNGNITNIVDTQLEKAKELLMSN